MGKEVAKQYVQNQIVKVSQILEKNIYDKDRRELIKRDISVKIKIFSAVPKPSVRWIT